LVVLNGDYFAAYIDNTLLAVVEDFLPGGGTQNELLLRSSSNAEVGIVKVAIWNLDELKWTNYQLLTAWQPSYSTNNFAPSQGWSTLPPGYPKFENGKLVMNVQDGPRVEVRFTNPYLRGSSSAYAVTFTPHTVGDSTKLTWMMRDNIETDTNIRFEYTPLNGHWAISIDPVGELVSGWAPVTPINTTATILVAIDKQHISAFYNGTLLKSLQDLDLELGLSNFIALWNNIAEYTRIDVIEIKFWSYK
jgi:hypothetical protein